MENVEERQHSKLIMASYGCGRAVRQFIMMSFAAFTFYFYESEIGLNTWLTTLGYIIYAIWNAVNDPIGGYLTNRPFKFTKKWGRFFPWTIIGGIPWIFSYLLIFLPPKVNPVEGQWIIFAWLVFSTCLFDSFATIFEINFWALFPMKFTSLKERRMTNGIGIPIGAVGVTLGGIVPPLLVTYGDTQSFVTQAGVVILGTLIIFSLTIPGLRDDPEMIERFLLKSKEKEARKSFFRSMKEAFKCSPFVGYVFLYLFFNTVTTLVQTSVAYIVRFVLGMQAGGQVLLQVGFLIGAVASTPFWVYVGQRANNDKKMMTIACVLLCLFSIFLSLFNVHILLFLLLIFWGIGLGGVWVYLSPVMASAVDDYTAKYEKHDEGILFGIQQFFGRFGIVLQALSFGIVHSLTGFVEGSAIQSAEAIRGIQLLFGIVPMIFMLIGLLLFLSLYNLTPDRIKINKERLKELKI
ncbi:MAG: MFS transporter [Promethearchaeota archaeon]